MSNYLLILGQLTFLIISFTDNVAGLRDIQWFSDKAAHWPANSCYIEQNEIKSKMQEETSTVMRNVWAALVTTWGMWLYHVFNKPNKKSCGQWS